MLPTVRCIQEMTVLTVILWMMKLLMRPSTSLGRCRGSWVTKTSSDGPDRPTLQGVLAASSLATSMKRRKGPERRARLGK